MGIPSPSQPVERLDQVGDPDLGSSLRRVESPVTPLSITPPSLNTAQPVSLTLASSASNTGVSGVAIIRNSRLHSWQEPRDWAGSRTL